MERPNFNTVVLDIPFISHNLLTVVPYLAANAPNVSPLLSDDKQDRHVWVAEALPVSEATLGLQLRQLLFL